MDIACPRVLHVLSILTGRPSSARLHNSSGVNTGGYSLMHENVYAMRWTANQIVRIRYALHFHDGNWPSRLALSSCSPYEVYLDLMNHYKFSLRV